MWRSVVYNPLHPYTETLLNAIPDPDPEKRRAVQGCAARGTSQPD